MTKKEIAAAKKRALLLISRIQQRSAKTPSPLRNLNKEEVIEALRRTREELWKEKIASSSGRQRIYLRTGTD